MKKCVIASDSFKGTLSSKQIADIFEDEFIKAFPHAKLEKIVLGDGGENTLEVFADHFKNGEFHTVEVMGPNWQKINAKYFTYDDVAVVELAEASGLWLATTRNPAKTTTFGVGLLIKDAFLRGYKRFYIALGGSSSTDGGCGLLSALGVKFYNSKNEEFVPVGETLNDIRKIDSSSLIVKDARFIILSDVNNPMYGEKGAAKVFAKQKGASNKQIEMLDHNLKCFNNLLIKQFGTDVSNIPGSGAAGATAAGILAFLDSEIVSGIDTILNLIHFGEIIKDADYVFTGEGKLDKQSFDGKLISGVLKYTKEQNIKTICICGISDFVRQPNEFYKVMGISHKNEPFDKIKKNAENNYRQTIKNCFSYLD